MSYLKPKVHHPRLPVNDLGLNYRDYEGAISTLCAGCGHDSISSALIQACFELSIPAHKVAKMSGIGCSSKTPTYFLGKSHGFNSVHGRMPSVATGANMANRDLVYIGVSGDGDTASIGMGQFTHVMRRNLNMLYVVENNGTYGLTKGQFSATTDTGSKSKKGVPNLYSAIDLCSLGIQMGATFVARSFSGDKDQLVPLMKAALSHRGFALLDVLSPCVTFNNHAGSMKSYEYIREHNEPIDIPDYVPFKKEITTEYEQGTSKDVELHDGSLLRLHKIDQDYDPSDRVSALTHIQKKQAEGQVPTGLFYVDPSQPDFHEILNTVKNPLNSLDETELCPGASELEKINASLR